jgi:predicted adenylyl cyclase CyaB
MSTNGPGQELLEVEIRAILPEDSDLLSRLDQAGFATLGVSVYRDEYYCPRTATSLDDVAMDAVGSFSLRLRSSPDTPTIGTLNTKVIVNEGDHSGWLEYETQVVNLAATRNILEAIGFKVFFQLAKTRTSFTRDDVSLHFEEIEAFGIGVELETFSSIGEQQQAKANLVRVLKELGIPEEAVVNKSLTFLVMQARAHF